MKINRLEQEYKITHPEYGDLIVIGEGSEEFCEILKLVSGKVGQAYVVGTYIEQGSIGSSTYSLYAIKEEHFKSINELAELTEGWDIIVTLGTFSLVDVGVESKMINHHGRVYYLSRPIQNTQSFKWITDRRPTEDDGMFVIVFNEHVYGKVLQMATSDVIKEGRPWANPKCIKLFDEDNPAPSPFDQE